MGYYDLCRETCEVSFKVRASKDTSIRHQKKCEEFLKLIQGVSDVEQIRQKYRDTLVKSNCLKEDDDEIYQALINNQKTK